MMIIFWLEKLFIEVYLILEMPNKEIRKRVKDAELKIAAALRIAGGLLAI